jgi:hypothetical protein
MMKNHLHLEPVERITGVDAAEIRHRYIEPGRPVIVSDLAAEWPALERWTPEFFRSRYGDLVVNVHDQTYALAGGHYLRRSSTMSFADYIDAILAGPSSLRLFVFRLLDRAPELRQDIILPRSLGYFPSRLLFLFFGGAGSAPPLHYDVDLPRLFHTVLHGEKRFVLYPPEETKHLYRHPFTCRSYVDLEHPDFERFPLLRQARGVECVLRAGETLHIPIGWWHRITYLTGGWGISFRQYEPRLIPLGIYNIVMRQSFDRLMNMIAGESWFTWKERRAEEHHHHITSPVYHEAD